MDQPDCSYILRKTGINLPLIGFYDTPDPEPFTPYGNTKGCLFSYFNQWQEGKFLQITKEQYGCGGAGKWLGDIETRSLEDYVTFLADDEGLKANHDLMREWLTFVKPYKQEFENLMVGPLHKSEYKYLKTVTFFVNPDQLSILMIGAQLHSRPTDPEPVIAPFGSGCMQMVSLFKDINIAQAIIGATDMAMRKYLPPDILAFTVTKPMFENLCCIGKDSYLNKPFIKGLKSARV